MLYLLKYNDEIFSMIKAPSLYVARLNYLAQLHESYGIITKDIDVITQIDPEEYVSLVKKMIGVSEANRVYFYFKELGLIN